MITAVFTSGFDHTEVSGLWQYDYGQKLRIQGLNLPPAVEIHFSLSKSGGDSESRVGVTKDGVTDVPIPDSMLENGGTIQNYYIYAFIYLTDKDSGKTVKWIQLHVNSRPKPEAFDSPEEKELFREAIAAVNESADRAKNAEKSSEAWAHGHEDYPERDEDNAKFYSDKAGEKAEETASNLQEVSNLANQVKENAETVASDKNAVEEFKKKAGESAENAAVSESNAALHENNAKDAQTKAETAQRAAEEAKEQVEKDKEEVLIAKTVVGKSEENVAGNKEYVRQTVENFASLAENAVDAVNTAGQNQVNNIEEAGQAALENISNGVDDSLTESGKAADAKKTGEKIDELKSDLDNVENALTIVKSRNYWNKNEVKTTTVWGQSLLMSQSITVSEGEKYYLSQHKSNKNYLEGEAFWAVYQYDANGNMTMSNNWVYEYVVPSGIVSVKFLNASTDYTYIMVEKDIQTLEWEEYYKPYYTCIDSDGRGQDIELVLPSKICGVVNKENNLYFENIILHSEMRCILGCTFDSSLTNVEKFRDRLVIKPTTSGKVNGIIRLYKNTWSHAEKMLQTTFVTAPQDTGTNEIKVLIIGDSKIAYGEVVHCLSTMFDTDNMSLTLLGSRYGNNNTGDTSNKHEGRGGWSTHDYVANQTVNGETNPFYNSDLTSVYKFDFSYYMNEQGYTDVDYVFICLGTNDFGSTSDKLCEYTDAIVDSIHSYNPNIKVVVGLNEGVYSPKMELLSRNESFKQFNKKKIAKYDNRESEKIYVLPIYTNLDLYNDYYVSTVPLSYADEVIGSNKTRLYSSDGIHQNFVGFYKFAQCIYYLIKCVESGLIN